MDKKKLALYLNVIALILFVIAIITHKLVITGIGSIFLIATFVVRYMAVQEAKKNAAQDAPKDEPQA